MQKNKKKKRVFPKFELGDLVEVREGMHFYWPTWSRENGYLAGGGTLFTENKIGKFVKTSPDSGPGYKIIEVEDKLYEIIHVDLKKI